MSCKKTKYRCILRNNKKMRDKTQQTKINFYTNIIALVANVLVGIYYTPYLVKSLGLAAYGILPLALIINQYISVATQTLTHSYTRFYSVALQKGDNDEASKDISSSMVVVLLISVLIIPLGLWIIVNVNSLFNIPYNLVKSSKYLFGFTILSFIVSLISSLLNVTLYAINRFDLMNVMKIIRTVFKLLVVIILFESISIDVAWVGLTNLLTEILVLGMSIYLFIKFKPKEVILSLSKFQKTVLYSILGMSIWVFIQVTGDTLLYRTDNLIVNHYWGTEASGALGAISEIGHYVSVIVNVLGSLFGPLILIAYAKEQHEEVKSLFIEQSTIVGCLSAVLTAAIAGCGSVLLDVWIGNEMGRYSWWLLLKMIVLPYYAAGGILAFVYRSWNKMKLPAIGTIALGVVDILILILVCDIIKPNNALIVLIISGVFSILQCFVLNIIAVGNIYPECRKAFVRISAKITISFVLTFFCARMIVNWIDINSLIQLAILLISVSVFMLSLVLTLILDKNERSKLFSIIK